MFIIINKDNDIIFELLNNVNFWFLVDLIINYEGDYLKFCEKNLQKLVLWLMVEDIYDLYEDSLYQCYVKSIINILNLI